MNVTFTVAVRSGQQRRVSSKGELLQISERARAMFRGAYVYIEVN